MYRHKSSSLADTKPKPELISINADSLGTLDLVSTPVHRVDLFEVVSSLPEVVERSTRGVIDGVVVLLSELTNEHMIMSADSIKDDMLSAGFRGLPSWPRRIQCRARPSSTPTSP